VSRSGVLNVLIEVETSGFQYELGKARGALMDLMMRWYYRFEVAGEDDGTTWGEWDVFV